MSATRVRMFLQHTIAIRSSPSGPVSHLRLGLLALAMFMTGVGGNSGLSAALNAKRRSRSPTAHAHPRLAPCSPFRPQCIPLLNRRPCGVSRATRLGCCSCSRSARASPPSSVASSSVLSHPSRRRRPTVRAYRCRPGDRRRPLPVSLDQAPYSRSSSLEMSRSRSPASRHRHPAQPLDTEHSGGDSDIAFTKPFDVRSPL